MDRSRFVTMSLVLVIFFIFCQIYQHNKIMKLVYKKQRLAWTKKKMMKKKDSLLVSLYKIKNQELVRKSALARGMCVLKPSQVVIMPIVPNNPDNLRGKVSV